MIQRGNRRQETFFCDEDYRAYLDVMHDSCSTYAVDIWAYCLMPNHVHLILVPETAEALAQAVGKAHLSYSRAVNYRQGWRGHLWQGRFVSYVMDERYLVACARYIETNPVRARLVANPTEWRWSSARAHLDEAGDGVVNVAPLLEIVGQDWASLILDDVSEPDMAAFRRHERSGRPLGDVVFVDRIESLLGRVLRPNRPGPGRRLSE